MLQATEKIFGWDSEKEEEEWVMRLKRKAALLNHVKGFGPFQGKREAIDVL